MIQAIKNNIVLVVAALSLVFAGMLLPATASAAIDTDKNLGCGSNVDLQGGQCGVQGGTQKVEDVITNIINIFSIIVGAVAVIMIIIGGFKYITSGGDSNNIGSAKNTILYAIVGLVIVAIAQAIVQFVLQKV